MENIPQFEALKGLKDAYNTAKNASEAAGEEVTTANEAYQTAVSNTTAAKNTYENDPNHALAIQAEQEYNNAITQSNNAEAEYNTASQKIETLTKKLNDLRAEATNKENLYNAAEDDVKNFSGQKTTETTRPETIIEEKPYPEYTVFYNAVKTLSTETAPILYYGFVDMGYEEIVIFATGTDIKEKVSSQIANDEGYEVVWYTKDIAPRNLKSGTNPDYDKGLNNFTFEGYTYTPAKCRFYYYEEDGTINHGEYEFTTVIKNALTAIVKTYENLKREFTETIEVPVTEDTEEYAKVKKDRDDALAAWNDAKENVAAKEKELSTAEAAEEKALSKLGTMSTLVQNKYNAWQKALDAEKPTREKWEKAQQAEEEALAAVTAAETKKENADKAVEKAKTNYNNAAKLLLGNDEIKYDGDLIICEAYTTIAIIDDFTEGVSTIAEWPAGYTLNGNGHIIETTGALFKTNNGDIDGLATPNGRIATDNKGKVTNSLTLWGKEYHAYDDVAQQIIRTSAEDAIYEMRDVSTFLFGYDVQTKEVQKLTDNNKLYEAKYANANNKSGYTFRFNLDGDDLVYDTEAFNNSIKGGYTLQNAMLYIENNDVTNAVKEQTNVAVKNGNAYVCKNAELKEGAGIKEFYISENVKATNLSYGRDFKQKVVAVCLPFELSADYIESKNIEVFQFNKVDANGVMWFTEKGSIAANKPCLIRFSGEQGDGAIFNKLSEQLLEKTPAELVENIGEYKFCGTYASAYPADLIGNTQGVLYGVQNGGLVKTDANSTSRLHQFRSYVWQPNAVSANAAPSYKIGLMDEDGNELSTAIETVTGEIVSGFKAKGGDSAIEITTDKACQVKVYTLSGALVKSTHVEAGSTSLPVKAGIYVVNGTKVIVK